MRTEHGEYWIEPSNQITSDSSVGRPHVIFKRSAVDKVEAYHRAKRTTDRRSSSNEQYRRLYEREFQKFHPRRNQNGRPHNSREAAERRLRENERLRRLEAARKRPIAFRAEMQRRSEQRINQSRSRSSSIETSHSSSRSVEQNTYMRNRDRNQMNRENRRRGAVKKHRRRRRRPRNCATKQPPFPWNITDVTRQAYGRNKVR